MMAKNQGLIIGDGAVGVAVGALLQSAGWSVGFVGRHGPVAVTATVERAGRAERLELAAPDLEKINPCLAVVAVKAYDLAAALAWTRHLPPAVPVWPLSNGAIYRDLEAAVDARTDLNWRLAYCTFGISSLGERRYAWRSTAGELAFGPLRDGGHAEPRAAERHIMASDPVVKWHPHMLWLHRRKWLYNTVINTLAADRKLPCNGDLLGDLLTLSAVFNEALALGTELWGAWPQAGGDLYQGMLQLIEATAANENSMARDVRSRRPTESAFLAGMAKDRKRYPLLTAMHGRLV